MALDTSVTGVGGQVVNAKSRKSKKISADSRMGQRSTLGGVA